MGIQTEQGLLNAKRGVSKSAIRPVSYSGSDFNIWAYFPISTTDLVRGVDTTRLYGLGVNSEDFVDVLNDLDIAKDALRKKGMSSFIPMNNVQTITTSYASSLSAVEEVGSSLPVDHTRGQKTYAGTLVFTVFDKEPLVKLLKEGLGSGYPGTDASSEYLSFDQMLPFNLVIQANSELPMKRGLPQSMMKIVVGIRFMTGGETISVDDFFLEQQHQYIARYVSPWVQVVPDIDTDPELTLRLNELLLKPKLQVEN